MFGESEHLKQIFKVNCNKLGEVGSMPDIVNKWDEKYKIQIH